MHARPSFYRRIEFWVVAGAVVLGLILVLPYFFNEDNRRRTDPSQTGADDSDPMLSSRIAEARVKLEQGIALNQQGEFDLAADCFREALDLVPEAHEPHFFLMLYHEEKARQGQEQGRAADVLKHSMMSGYHARQVIPHFPDMKQNDRDLVLEAIYNSSKAALVMEDKPLGLALLKLAVEQGFANRQEIESEPIFDAVRALPEYNQILQLIKPPQ